MTANKTILNFSGGEVSRDLTCRLDLPIRDKVLQRMRNWISDVKGKAVFRAGSKYVHHTKDHQAAVFIPFHFSDQQAYLIEATDQVFRFYKDDGIILGPTPKTITGITQANPGVVTYTGDDPANGDEVYIEDVVGMTELNGRFFIVANVDTGANTFELNDAFGNNVDTSGYTAYSSAGQWTEIYELATSYLEADLELLNYAQTADTMYIAHSSYDPYKVSRLGHNSWTWETYTRTSDPFPASVNVASMGTLNLKWAVTTSTAHGFVSGNIVSFTGVGGTTEVNGNEYMVWWDTTTRFYLADPVTGIPEDPAGFSAYTSGGTVQLVDTNPGAVAFTDDARTVFGRSDAKPETLWFSRSPSTAGAVRFDDYTTGSSDDNAAIFTLAPIKQTVDTIRWIANTSKYLAVGTYATIRRVFGETENSPVTPTSISAKGTDSEGVHTSKPVTDGSALFYITRDQKKVETIEYDYQVDNYNPDDKNLITDHLSEPGLKCLARQGGNTPIIWVCREDGKMLGLTYKGKENLAGWHLHTLAGGSADNFGVVEWVEILPRDNNQDQLWMIVKRTINGNTVRQIEYFSDYVIYPDADDFFQTGADKTEDFDSFYAYQWEKRKDAIHMDAVSTYDGSSYGTEASATLTPASGAATVGTENVAFTAGASVFDSSMVGRELWGKYDDAGGGGGRAVITSYVSATVVWCTITEAWPIQAFAAGDWFLTATTVSNLHYLEGETVGVVADGSVEADATVSDGAITLDAAASVIHIGLKYTGEMKTLPIDIGGVTGSALDKIKNISEITARVKDTAPGLKFGTSLYDLKEFTTQPETPLITDRPLSLQNGVLEQRFSDSWKRDKMIHIRQENPTPASVLGLNVYTETTDE